MGSRACKLLTGWMAITAFALVEPPAAAAQKPGGTVQIYNSTNPPSASPHEDTTIAVVMPFMAVYNNLVRFDRSSRATASTQSSRSWRRAGTDATQDQAHLQAPLRRQVARRQAVHGQGCPVHVSPAQREGARIPAAQSARHLVRAPDRGHAQRRLRGDIQLGAAAAVAARHARLRLHGRLPLPRPRTRHARQTDRHRPFKFVEFKSNESIRLVKNPDYWKRASPTSMPSSGASCRAARAPSRLRRREST